MKKILFVIIFVTLFIGMWHTCLATDLLLDYPEIPGVQKLEESSDLPQIINYIYKFALLACGITAFISILIGAIKYVTSAGNASVAGDAKNRITQALLGILVLLCAVLILRTINPDLVTLSFTLPKTPSPTVTPEEIKNYQCMCCCIYAGQPSSVCANPIQVLWGLEITGKNTCKNLTELAANNWCKSDCKTNCTTGVQGVPVSGNNYSIKLCP